MSAPEITRREALAIAGVGALVAGTRIVSGQSREQTAAVLKPPVNEVVNVDQFEQEAKATLPEAAYVRIAGGDRTGFNRISLRPRQNVSTLEMNLDTPLFGQTLFTPIIVGPMAEQGLYHPEGELATMRGATAGNTMMIVSSRSTVPLARIAQEANGPFWFGVYAGDTNAPEQARTAAATGAGAIFLTVGVTYGGPALGSDRISSTIDWSRVGAVRQGLNLPVIVKGVRTPEEAEAAIRAGADGIVVSNHGSSVPATTIDVLPSIVQAVGGRIPVLADGSFRRGTDVLKAIALGAKAVLMGRPIIWGLAGYGAEGVQYVLQLTQNELARSCGMIGAVVPADLSPASVRIHRIPTA